MMTWLLLEQVSWCKFEVTVDCSKDIKVANNPTNIGEIPPVVVTAINLKTVINQKQNTNEIASASVICCHRAKVPYTILIFCYSILTFYLFIYLYSFNCISCVTMQIDTPMLASEWTRPGMLSHFTVVRKLEDGLFPMGFNKEAADRNSKAGSNIISMESRQVLSCNCFSLSPGFSSLINVSIGYTFAVKELY